MKNKNDKNKNRSPKERQESIYDLLASSEKSLARLRKLVELSAPNPVLEGELFLLEKRLDKVRGGIDKISIH